MAVPVLEFSSFELTMVASQGASATVANILFVLPVMLLPSAQEKSPQTQAE